MSDMTLVRAFKIRSAVGWMKQDMGSPDSAACVITCVCGHTLGVNDAWGSVYEPKAGGWLLVNQAGTPVYRSDIQFKATCVHVKDNFFNVPTHGDIKMA